MSQTEQDDRIYRRENYAEQGEWHARRFAAA